MVSRDLVPMRDRIAGPRRTGKPLQIAVDVVTGTTEALARPRSQPQGTAMSALRPEADIRTGLQHVRFVQKADVQFPPSGYSTHPRDSAFAHSGRPFASARADADAQS
jgi:hypothetical protein